MAMKAWLISGCFVSMSACTITFVYKYYKMSFRSSDTTCPQQYCIVESVTVLWVYSTSSLCLAVVTVRSLCLCQKLAVRSCPVGTTKPLSLIKPPSQGIAISVVPAKAPVSMVTAHINGQKAASTEPLQTSPINLQTAGRVATAGVHSFNSRRELPSSQVPRCFTT